MNDAKLLYSRVKLRRVATRFTPLAISGSLRPGVYKIGYGPPCKWCYACSPPTPNTGSPINSTPTGQDPNEYRATTRNLLQLGGTITYTRHSTTVRLNRPTTPRITRTLTLLTDQLNTNPPHIPATPALSAYTITTP